MSASRSLLIKLLRGFAGVWTALTVAVVFIGYAAIWWRYGFWNLMEITDYRNLWNFFAILITWSPALGAYTLADRLDRPA